MTAVMDKAKISGITGGLAAVITLISSYSTYFILAGFTVFFVTLLIQYGSIKFKVVASLTTILFLLISFISGGQLP